MEHRDAPLANGFSLRDAPGSEFFAVGQLEPFEKGTRLLYCRLQRFRRRLCRAFSYDCAQAMKIDGFVRQRQPHGFPVGDEALLVRSVNQPSQLAQTPAQGATRIVRYLPEELAQSIPSHRSTGHREVGQKAPRLTRIRQRKRLTVQGNGHRAQKIELNSLLGC